MPNFRIDISPTSAIPLLQFRPGFTLIELLVAVTLIGVIAGLGMPKLSGLYERQKLSNGANEIVDILNRAHSMAASNTQPDAKTAVVDDCGPTSSDPVYVDYYQVGFTNVGSDATKYFLSEKDKAANRLGVACDTSRDGRLVLSRNLPIPVKAMITGGTSAAGEIIKYKTTYGSVSTSAGISTSGALLVVNTNLNNTYNCVYIPSSGAPAYTVNRSGDYTTATPPCP